MCLSQGSSYESHTGGLDSRTLDRGFALDDDDMAAIAALEGRVTKT